MIPLCEDSHSWGGVNKTVKALKSVICTSILYYGVGLEAVDL